MKIWFFLLIIFTTFKQQVPTKGSKPVVASPINSSVTFKISNADIVANGKFEQVDTQIEFNPNQIEKTHFHCSINIETIKTGIRLRDQHLKKPVYFNAALFPRIEVNLLKIEQIEAGKLTGLFAVSMKGITKNISIPFRWKKENGAFQFDSEFDINRRDFNVGGKSWTLADIARVKVSFSVLSDLASN